MILITLSHSPILVLASSIIIFIFPSYRLQNIIMADNIYFYSNRFADYYCDNVPKLGIHFHRQIVH